MLLQPGIQLSDSESLKFLLLVGEVKNSVEHCSTVVTMIVAASYPLNLSPTVVILLSFQ
jgi:hypothetical protein